MDVTFADDDLKRLEDEVSPASRHAQNIVKAFKKVMRVVRDALDERDIRAMKSLRFEQLKGDRSHQHSLRLNAQWRLIFEIKDGSPKNTIRIIGIEDYH